MMGGARHPADEARVESLLALAKKRGVEVSAQPSRRLAVYWSDTGY
jgi:hypothetical protein